MTFSSEFHKSPESISITIASVGVLRWSQQVNHPDDLLASLLFVSLKLVTL